MKPTPLLLIALLAVIVLGAQTPPQNSAPALSLSDLSSSLEVLVNRVRPAVVQIFSTGYAAAEESATTTTSLLTKQHSTGSGVIVAEDGYIITNAHVVRGARLIQVRLPSSRRDQPATRLVEAKLVGMDREIDLAVLSIEKTGLSHLPLGDSERLRQGEVVIAFGNPLGLEGSVSMGIVSSTGRQLHPDDLMSYIQTDAPINPGNSGGPLIDSLGSVVGINTFILTQSGGSEGLGFAIPSNLVQRVYTQIRREGHVHRGRIGVYAQTITPAIAEALSLGQDSGVILSDVEPEGEADKAGAKVGDIVLTLNDKIMHTAPQLEMAIFRETMGQKVTLAVLRGTDHLTIEVPVAESDDDPQRFADLVNPEDNLIPRLGILGIGIDKKLAALLPDLRNAYGVVVAAGSATDIASGTGLKPGDVIYSVNGTPISTVAVLKNKINEFKTGQEVVMQIERSGRLMFVTLELE
ncbi:MAG TPA: trypsin-like peptidase domain-containing protein [Bryobacteraceae bacterium]|nr:trypsin-like peptidase domain-containing protein [Bryobacteraceae bacterium]